MLLHLHDGDDPNAVRLIQVNYGLRKPEAEVSSRWRIKLAKALRMRANLGDQTFDFTIKPDSKLRINFGIIANGIRQFFVCLWMKNVPHSPAIFRARASDSSTGMP